MSKFKIGDWVRFESGTGNWVTDVVTGHFTQECLLEPYGRNYTYPALLLKNHSWVGEKDAYRTGINSNEFKPATLSTSKYF